MEKVSLKEKFTPCSTHAGRSGRECWVAFGKFQKLLDATSVILKKDVQPFESTSVECTDALMAEVEKPWCTKA